MAETITMSNPTSLSFEEFREHLMEVVERMNAGLDAEARQVRCGTIVER